MEVHTPSPLRAIFAQCTIGLDSDVLRDLVPFVQVKNVKNTHGGLLLLVKLQAKSLHLLPKLALRFGICHGF